MLTLYHAPTIRSFRIKWLLNELDQKHRTEPLDFYGFDRHAPVYRAVSPSGSVPAMTDGDLILTGSGSIINYIVRHYGQGRFAFPDGSREQARVDEWMFWSEGLFAVHQRIYWDHCAPPGGLIDQVAEVGQEAKRQTIRYAEALEASLRETG